MESQTTNKTIALYHEHLLPFEKNIIVEQKETISDECYVMYIGNRQYLKNLLAGMANYLATEDYKTKILYADTREKALSLLLFEENIALILFTISDKDKDLELIRSIRKNAKYKIIRIILIIQNNKDFFGQQEIVEYDISGYKIEKDLNPEGLLAIISSTIKSHHNMKLIKDTQIEIEQLSEYSDSLLAHTTINMFSEEILNQLKNILKFHDVEEFAVLKSHKENDNYNYKVVYSQKSSIDFYVQLPQTTKLLLNKVTSERKTMLRSNMLVAYCEVGEYGIHLIYIKDKKQKKSQINQILKQTLEYFLRNISTTLKNIYLNEELIAIQKELIYSMSCLSEHRSGETAEHIKRVAVNTALLAKEYGLPTKAQEILKYASTMHDIGKIGIPDSVLQKPGRLDKKEVELMKKHTTIGHSIFCNSKHEILKKASQIALYHHENYDGTGYPEGLKGEEIPLCARIVAIVDTFDALTHKRCYKDAWSIEQSVEFIQKNASKKFDPTIVDIFIKNIDKIII